MRYRDSGEPLPLYSEASSMNDMVLFTVVLSLFIGIILTALGWKGRQMWLTVWAAGLVVCSVLYIGWDVMRRF